MLTGHLLEMGERFCETAERLARSEIPARDETVFQNLHWGLELVLKVYLHSCGWHDERCIGEVRHDIAKVLAASERCGLRDVTDDARVFVAALSPYSQVHCVDAFVKTGSGAWTIDTAMEATARLLEAVRTSLLDKESDRGKPSPAPKPEVSADPFCGAAPRNAPRVRGRRLSP